MLLRLYLNNIINETLKIKEWFLYNRLIFWKYMFVF